MFLPGALKVCKRGVRNLREHPRRVTRFRLKPSDFGLKINNLERIRLTKVA